MTLGKVQLRNSILGWGLIPVDGEHKKVLDTLYGTDYDALKKSEIFCMKGSIEKVVAEVKRVADDCGLRLSLCGNKEAPTIRVWADKPKPKPKEVSVDLKWSLWLGDQGCWEEYASGVWEQMKDAFEGLSGPIIVHTSPRKEIRSGYVIISKGGAEGRFTAEWDEPHTLLETLGIGEDQEDILRECLPFSSATMEPGLDQNFSVKAKKFEDLMRKVDRQESELLGRDEKVWESIKESFRKDEDNG